MRLDELMIECIDALQGPGWDGSERGQHVAEIEKAILSEEVSADVADLLLAAATHFRKNAAVPEMTQAMANRKTPDTLAEALKPKIGPAQYVYHGTIFGRLAGIAQEGFVPSKVPVWKEKQVPRDFLARSVFFTTSWRGAMSWAQAAHLFSRGRKIGLHRMPVVIRIPASGLHLESDPRATVRGCLMVTGPVPSNNAQVIVGEVRGFPTWLPMRDALAFYASLKGGTKTG